MIKLFRKLFKVNGSDFYEEFPSFCGGFPPELREAVEKVVNTLPRKTYSGDRWFFSGNKQEIKYFSGENLISFPYRVYFLEVNDSIIAKMSATEKTILHCIYSRSCDGYIREKHVRALLSEEFPAWAIPYIVKVCDEYILEILQVVYENLKERNTDEIKRFCAANREVFCKSYDRMTSYWNEYYRTWNEYYGHDCYELKNYAGRKLFVECFGATRPMKCL